MEIAIVMLKVLGVTLLLVGSTFVVMGFATIIWIKSKVKDHLYVIMFASNRQVSTQLVRVTSESFEIKIPGGEKEKYLVSPQKTFWVLWPPMFPNWLREAVPCHAYVSNQIEPIDPYQVKSIMTAKSLRYITDEGMLRQTWREAKEAAGVKVLRTDPLLFILTLLAAFGVAFAIYSIYQLSAKVDMIMKAIGV